MSLSTPILYLIFNRPNQTEITFQRLREIQPSKLYVAADGPRENKEGESEKVAKTRAITEKIDWPCEVKRLYRDQNLGCGKAVSEAITWFFEQEEQGIIIEDDILPDPTFFRFCEEMLHRFAEDESVFQISGFNYFHTDPSKANSYFLAKTSPIWGWATWRRAWAKNDFFMKDWPIVSKKEHWKSYFHSKEEAEFEMERLAPVYNQWYTWDLQWDYSKRIHQGFTVLPYVNLVKNIGFGNDATHTRFRSVLDIPAESFTFPIKAPQHPKPSEADKKALAQQKREKRNHQRIAWLNTYIVPLLLKLKLR